MSSSIISKYINNGIKDKSLNTSNSFKSKKTKKKTPLSYILGGLVLLLLVVGSATALYLTQNNQDVRQQAAGSGEIYCGGCLNRNMPAQDTDGTWMRCNDWIDRECQVAGCAGEGTSWANQQCCAPLNPCQNGRCGYSCTSDNKQQCGKYVEGSDCNNGGRWVCDGSSSGHCEGGVWNQPAPTTTTTTQNARQLCMAEKGGKTAYNTAVNNCTDNSGDWNNTQCKCIGASVHTTTEPAIGGGEIGNECKVKEDCQGNMTCYNKACVASSDEAPSLCRDKLNQDYPDAVAETGFSNYDGQKRSCEGTWNDRTCKCQAATGTVEVGGKCTWGTECQTIINTSNPTLAASTNYTAGPKEGTKLNCSGGICVAPPSVAQQACQNTFPGDSENENYYITSTGCEYGESWSDSVCDCVSTTNSVVEGGTCKLPSECAGNLTCYNRECVGYISTTGETIASPGNNCDLGQESQCINDTSYGCIDGTWESQGSCGLVTTKPSSTPVSCDYGKLCNCAPNDLCIPIGGNGETYKIDGGPYNGQTCFEGVAGFNCVERETTETIVSGGSGGSCEIGQRTACATDGCDAGQQRLCQGGPAGLGECTWTDRCIGDSDRGNGEITGEGSCEGLKRASYGEPSRGGFIGCQGSLNCFCQGGGDISTGQTYSSGNVVCYEDLHNDSCGAPGVGGTTPETPSSTTTPETSTPPGYTPPSSTPPATNYFCNSTCENNSQCQTSDSNFICSAEYNNKCRLNTNPSSNECQPAIGPMCLDIDLVDNQTGEILTDDPSYGDSVKFTCAQVIGVDHYIFRVIEPDNNIVDLDATGRTSVGYTISKSGKFHAQCQICTTSDDSSCNSYEALN